MTVLRHLKPLFWIAVIASICVTPMALMFAYSPFHDVNDFFNFGLCDHIESAEECAD
jgi:putative membrane protein